MKVQLGRVAKVTAASAVLIGVAGFVAPTLDAERMRKPLTAALEQTLGRPVEFREVRYQIFPKPGLSATDLLIPDDPAFGVEPLAYVGELQAGFSFTSLLTGRLDISSVRLVEASVNLARRDELGWNFRRVLERMAEGVKKSGTSPKVEFRESRINFRAGTLKSVFFLNAVDLDLDPPGGTGGAFRWRYEASPARTDRAGQGLGRFTGSGRWTPGVSGTGRIAIDVELERSPIGEALTLITGSDLGVQGRFTTRATLDGSLDDLQVRGSVEIADVDRPGFFGLRSNRFSLPYEGHLNIVGQTLEFTSRRPEDAKSAPPLAIRLSCQRLLADPHWEAGFEFDELPAPALLDLARRLGARAPGDLKVEGTVAGSLTYSQLKPTEGEITVRGGQVSVSDAQPLKVGEARIRLQGSDLSLESTGVITSENSEAEVSGRWNMESEELEFEVKTERLKLEELRGAVDRLQGVTPIPLMDACREGEVGGSLRYERAAESSELRSAPEREQWNGDLRLRQVRCAVEGAAHPVRLRSAVLFLRKGGWSLRKAEGVWGRWPFTGELFYQTGAARAMRFSLNLAEVQGPEIDEFLSPALAQSRGFIDRTLRRRPVLPGWLRGRHAEGDLRIGALHVADETFKNLSGRAYWDGRHVEMPDVTAHWEGALFSGRASVQLGGQTPEYHVLGRIDGYASKAGIMDAELELVTPSLSDTLAATLRGSAQVSGRNIDLGEEQARTLNACVDYDGARGVQRLKVTCLDAHVAGEWMSAQALSAVDGKLVLELVSPRRTMRLAGTLAPLQLGPVVH